MLVLIYLSVSFNRQARFSSLRLIQNSTARSYIRSCGPNSAALCTPAISDGQKLGAGTWVTSGSVVLTYIVTSVCGWEAGSCPYCLCDEVDLIV